jgi:hypothetical protein
MKLLLKILGGLFVLLIVVAAAVRLFVHEAEPIGTPSPEADALTEKMFKAIDKPAWDSTAIISWNFGGRQKHLWDKTRHLSQIEWGENKVLLNIQNITGKAFVAGNEVTGETAQSLVKKAWDHFNNDSFWLNAPAKAMDGGTVRSIVKLNDGREGLKVQYTSGGTTPGDSYVWILDENGLPTSYKMWVGIIPIGGLEFGWSDYMTLYSGAKISQMHKSSAFDLQLTEVKAGKTFADVGLAGDPFVGI